jgi:hypothetical protein
VYNDTSQFLNYVGKCVDGALYTGLTELYPITILPKNIRKQKQTIKTRYLYKNILDTIFLSNDIIGEEPKVNINRNNDNLFSKYEYIEIWNEINKDFPSLVKKIMKLKYSYEFDIIRTNKEIAELIGCSQQKVITNINRARNLLSHKL